MAGAAVFMASAASPALGASYVFGVEYNGNGNAALAAGSDDLLGTTLLAGDDFTYTLSAASGSYWETTAPGKVFFTPALVVANGSRYVNYSVNYLNNGASVFGISENGVSNDFVHLGANVYPVTAGLHFDQILLSVDILSGSDSTPQSLLPYPGQGPEQSNPGIFRYVQGAGAVPEPGTWAMMLLGFGLVGGAMRSARRKQKALVSYV
jgi:hypothetical protein